MNTYTLDVYEKSDRWSIGEREKSRKRRVATTPRLDPDCLPFCRQRERERRKEAEEEGVVGSIGVLRIEVTGSIPNSGPFGSVFGRLVVVSTLPLVILFFENSVRRHAATTQLIGFPIISPEKGEEGVEGVGGTWIAERLLKRLTLLVGGWYRFPVSKLVVLFLLEIGREGGRWVWLAGWKHLLMGEWIVARDRVRSFRRELFRCFFFFLLEWKIILI